MDPHPVSTTYHWWHSPWLFVIVSYVVLAGASLFGLKRRRASADKYVLWPVTSLITLVPVAFLTAVLQELAAPAGNTLAAAGSNLIIGVVCMIAGGYVGGLFWASRGVGPQAAHNRGAKVEPVGAASGARAFASASRLGGDSVTLAGVPVPLDDETKHFKLMGTTGVGKRTAMRELLDKALKRGDRAIIADPDGGYLSRFYDPLRGDIILNPFDARSAKWDLYSELRHPYDIAEMARALIPDLPKADPTWTGYARTLFEAVVSQTQGCGMDAAALHRLLTAGSLDQLKVLLNGTPAAPFLEGDVERFFRSVQSTTSQHVKCLGYLGDQRAPDFSVRSWIKSGSGVLFLPYQADQIVALRALISTWMRLAIIQALSLEEKDWRIWFSVDELDALGPIDGLSDALPRLRKVGGRCALGFQSISQVSTTYGEGPAQAMVENCGTSLILRCSASERGGTSAFASRLIGDRQVTRIVHSTNEPESLLQARRASRGTSEQHSMEPAVMPAEIEQLPDRTGFLKFPSQTTWMRVSFPYYDLPVVAEKLRPPTP